MKILIVGLGLIGGSYALALKKKGYQVYGVDNNLDTIKYAIDNNMVNEVSNDPKDFIEDMDVIVICLYPKAILDFIKEYNYLFKKGQIVTDVCGVKTSFVYEANNIINNATYVSHHPMAGREKIGIKYADDRIFLGANFLITPVVDNALEIEVIKKLAYDMGFGRISVISPEFHDKMIGFTSQLTHAIAVSLVNSDSNSRTKEFIGDSYRDLTRIAMINEVLWSELFLENKNDLIAHIDNFLEVLDGLKKALINDDKETLKELFIKSTNIRKEMEK